MFLFNFFFTPRRRRNSRRRYSQVDLFVKLPKKKKKLKENRKRFRKDSILKSHPGDPFRTPRT